jgi:hypothetical protein
MANLPLPLKNPAPRTSTHGAQMSARMARCHQFLGASPWGVSLDFNTDDGMSRAAPRLQAAKEHVLAIQAGKVKSECSPSEIADLLTDIDGYIRRVPASRVDSRTARQVTSFGSFAGLDTGANSAPVPAKSAKSAASGLDALMAGFTAKLGKK